MNPNSPKRRIIGLFPQLLGVGGVQLAGRLTATALREIASRHGLACDFFALNDSPSQQDVPADSGPIPIRSFERNKIDFVRQALAAARNNGRVVVAAHPNLAVPAALIKGVCSGIKTIVMSHGVEVWQPLSPVRRSSLRLADLILAPSRYTEQKLVEVQGIAAQQIRRVPWPVNPAILPLAVRAAGLPRLPAFPQGKVILTVGRCSSNERYKGADSLIRAVAQISSTIPDVALVAAGTGDDLPRLRQLASELNISARIYFFERLSLEELTACYAHCSLFALPSTGEGFGFVFLEAMAFSKAVVGVAAGGVTDLIEDGVNGLLLPPNDQPMLADSLARLLVDAALRDSLGSNGAKQVREKYQFRNFCDQIEGILEGLGISDNISDSAS